MKTWFSWLVGGEWLVTNSIQSNGFAGVASGSLAAAITVIGPTAENRVFLQFFLRRLLSFKAWSNLPPTSWRIFFGDSPGGESQSLDHGIRFTRRQ